MAKRVIEFDDLDQAVKVSYRLGVLDGQDDIHAQMVDLHRKLSNMLKTNKSLFQLLNEESKKTRGQLRITLCFTRSLLDILHKTKNYNQYWHLKKKYEKVAGEKYIPTRKNRR